MNRRRRSKRDKPRRRVLSAERLEVRQLLAGDLAMHNAESPADVNGDGKVSALDALAVVNYLGRQHKAEGEPVESTSMVDVDNSGTVTALDALRVINHLALEAEMISELPEPLDYSMFGKAAGVDDGIVADPEFAAVLNEAEDPDASGPVVGGSQNLLEAADVDTLLSRASMATSSDDAIIAVVDRSGRILGVRVEDGVDAGLQADPERLAFAIDGAVAKARTAAFFSSNAAPLPSRTIRFISQSTITQREVESASAEDDPAFRGPGFVAPIGVGGHFPPEVSFTPQVDLFAIEHQSRDSQISAGADGIQGNVDDFALRTRFNVDPTQVPVVAQDFFKTWPESYGVQTEKFLDQQSRGIATLPGGIPLYKIVTNDDGTWPRVLLSQSINLVGGIGVFFPGEDGYATHEQGFVHSDVLGRRQSEAERTNADKVLEAEFAAFIAAAGTGLVGPHAFLRDLTEFNADLPALPDYILPTARIDLVGITLEVFGPTPSRAFPIPGVDRLIGVGRALGRGVDSGVNQEVNKHGDTLLAGQAVPEKWLVAPHDSSIPGGLTAADVEEIITRGIDEALRTRAAIRLDIDNNFRPGVPTGMVLAVADNTGEVLGLYRMPDATIFSIDVAVAKARNTAYYADATALMDEDRVDFDGDGTFGTVATTLDGVGDTLPLGTALTNRTFRFLVEPRYPTGSEIAGPLASGLVNDPDLSLCEQKPGACEGVAPQSILRMPGINPLTAENLISDAPLDYDVYATEKNTFSVLAFDAFNPATNFRDAGDAGVIIQGDGTPQPLANRNGVVFFPGSSPLYLTETLVGGFGVSGDGVDQDDVVTFAGQGDFAPPAAMRVDQFPVGNVRLPFQKFNRNPFLS